MPLLTNNDIRIHPRCARMVVVGAAIYGPHFKQRNWETCVVYTIYAVATLIILMDLFVWRR